MDLTNPVKEKENKVSMLSKFVAADPLMIGCKITVCLCQLLNYFIHMCRAEWCICKALSRNFEERQVGDIYFKMVAIKRAVSKS